MRKRAAVQGYPFSRIRGWDGQPSVLNCRSKVQVPVGTLSGHTSSTHIDWRTDVHSLENVNCYVLTPEVGKKGQMVWQGMGLGMAAYSRCGLVCPTFRSGASVVHQSKRPRRAIVHRRWTAQIHEDIIEII